jgi:hypothetical protein
VFIVLNDYHWVITRLNRIPETASSDLGWGTVGYILRYFIIFLSPFKRNLQLGHAKLQFPHSPIHQLGNVPQTKWPTFIEFRKKVTRSFWCTSVLRFQVFTAVSMKMAAFWEKSLCTSTRLHGCVYQNVVVFTSVLGPCHFSIVTVQHFEIRVTSLYSNNWITLNVSRPSGSYSGRGGLKYRPGCWLSWLRVFVVLLKRNPWILL